MGGTGRMLRVAVLGLRVQVGLRLHHSRLNLARTLYNTQLSRNLEIACCPQQNVTWQELASLGLAACHFRSQSFSICIHAHGKHTVQFTTGSL